MNRRTLLGTMLAVPVALAGGPGEYVTPKGDEPLELWHSGKWWNAGFDQLIPGDTFRKKRDPEHMYQMVKRQGSGIMTVTQLS